MGDSITDAWPQPRFGAFFPGKNYVGRGISGQTTPQMLIRMRPDVIAFKPKVVVILGGTNDIAGNTGPMTDEQIEGNLASMAELAAANGIKVVLSSITPVQQLSRAQPQRRAADNAAAAHACYARSTTGCASTPPRIGIVPGLLPGDDRRQGDAESGIERRRSAPERRRLRDHGAARGRGDSEGVGDEIIRSVGGGLANA